MTLKQFALALALLASATTLLMAGATTRVLAQSQPNYGPARNGGGDTYGEPYSGSAGARQRSGGW
jgi:hypothetical protein